MDNHNIAIRLENLSKTFGRRKRKVEAVRGINLEVTSGPSVWVFRA